MADEQLDDLPIWADAYSVADNDRVWYWEGETISTLRRVADWLALHPEHQFLELHTALAYEGDGCTEHKVTVVVDPHVFTKTKDL